MSENLVDQKVFLVLQRGAMFTFRLYIRKNYPASGALFSVTVGDEMRRKL